MHKLRLFAIIVVCGLLISGCRHTRPDKVETTLYFGLSRPDGTLISDSSWRQFEKEEILSVFPEGFTVYSAQGVWKGSTGLVEESSKVLVFIHPQNDSLSDRIDTLRKHYREQFKQDAVLRTDDELSRTEL